MLASGKSRFDAKSVAAVARKMTAVAYDTRWSDIKDAGGCGLGIFPSISVHGVSSPSRNSEICDLVSMVKIDIERLVKSRPGGSRSVGASLTVPTNPTNPHVDLIISVTPRHRDTESAREAF